MMSRKELADREPNLNWNLLAMYNSSAGCGSAPYDSMIAYGEMRGERSQDIRTRRVLGMNRQMERSFPWRQTAGDLS